MIQETSIVSATYDLFKKVKAAILEKPEVQQDLKTPLPKAEGRVFTADDKVLSEDETLASRNIAPNSILKYVL